MRHPRAPFLRPRVDERAESLLQRLHSDADERHLGSVGLLRSRAGLVVEECEDGLAEREAFDREDPVPPGVELVDHDVGLAVQRERLVVADALDDPQVDVEGFAGRDDVLRPLPPPRRGGVDDDGPFRSRGGTG